MTSVAWHRAIQSILMMVIALGVLGCFALLSRMIGELQSLRHELIHRRPRVLSDEELSEAITQQAENNRENEGQ